MTPQTQAQIQPYLFFEGRAEEAIEFYKKAPGAKVEMLMRYKDNPDPQPGMAPPGAGEKVLHACIRVGEAPIMLSDGMCSGKSKFGGFSLSVNANDDQDAKRLFTALGEGGQVQLPLAKTFFSPCFGMLSDRFGVAWMVIVQPR